MTPAPPTNDLVTRTGVVLRPDARRVLARLFVPGGEGPADEQARVSALLDRILALSSDEVSATLTEMRERYAGRHRDLSALFEAHYRLVAEHRLAGRSVSADRRTLIGAWHTHEYAIEGAALFNPSVVAHPDQHGVEPGHLRFALSLRAVGEGHRSTVEFRSGVIGPDRFLRIDPPGPYVELGTATMRPDEDGPAAPYDVVFAPESALAERVLWPFVAAESRGMEDVRFTRFVDDEGDAVFRATYTAFDGTRIAPRLLHTADFRHFSMSPLDGPAARNKGMALFPRPVGGRHLALTRSDSENILLASSADGVWWGDSQILHRPRAAWELTQTGNCGSPVETEAGWLALTHGVGAMREYAIGALLLDLDDPTQVLGALDEPLLRPDEEERDGYVPNVVYSCGSLLHGDDLLLPYGASDACVRFAFVDVPRLLDRLTARGPRRSG